MEGTPMTAKDRMPSGSAGGQEVGKLAASDTVHTEAELMDRAVEEARQIPPPPDPTGTLADPVAGTGFTGHESSHDNRVADTTVSQPFEDLASEDDPGRRSR